MRKMRLSLDHLHVESFTTTPEAQRSRGTVHAHGTELTCNMTVCVGQCGGYGQTEVGSCACPTEGGCVYPTAANHSCDEMGWVTNEVSCRCLYPNTDVRVCCSYDGCSLAVSCMA